MQASDYFSTFIYSHLKVKGNLDCGVGTISKILGKVKYNLGKVLKYS